MNIILTGCAGFIGSRVCSMLIEQGHSVTGIDILNDAYDVKLKNYRLNLLGNLSNFQFLRIDISDREGLSDVFEKNTNTDAVINLAARAGVRDSIKMPLEYYQTNVIGTINLLEMCREYNIGKFVQASTSSLYGENERPFTEDMNTDETLSPYAASKKAAENICYTYHRLYNIDITVLRYFTVYGPAGRPDMSPFRFIRWIAEDEEVIVYGDGTFERDFTYVDDIAEGTVLSLNKLGYEIINLGNDKPHTMNDLIKCIENKLGKKARVVNKEEQMADVSATRANISKAGRLLSWSPNTDIEEGIGLTVDWYNKNRDLAKSIELSLY